MNDILIVLVMTPYREGGTEYMAYGPFFTHQQAALYAADYGDDDSIEIIEVSQPELEDSEPAFTSFLSMLGDCPICGYRDCDVCCDRSIGDRS